MHSKGVIYMQGLRNGPGNLLYLCAGLRFDSILSECEDSCNQKKQIGQHFMGYPVIALHLPKCRVNRQKGTGCSVQLTRPWP
jgi:hypothetical protein